MSENYRRDWIMIFLPRLAFEITTRRDVKIRDDSVYIESNEDVYAVSISKGSTDTASTVILS